MPSLSQKRSTDQIHLQKRVGEQDDLSSSKIPTSGQNAARSGGSSAVASKLTIVDNGRERRHSFAGSLTSARNSSPGSSRGEENDPAMLTPLSSTHLSSGSSPEDTAKRSFGLSRSSSFFRIGRTPFSKRKQGRTTTNSTALGRDVTASIDSSRSTASSSGTGGNASGIVKREPSPFGNTLSLPRKSLASSREGTSNSDADGERASSDLGSALHAEGVVEVEATCSASDLANSSLMEGFDLIDTSQTSSSFTSDAKSAVMRSQGAGQGILANTEIEPRRPESRDTIQGSSSQRRTTPSRSPHSPRSPRIRSNGGFIPPPAGQPPSLPLPPIPKGAFSSARTFDAQRATTLQRPKSSGAGVSSARVGHPIQQSWTTVKSGFRKSMVDDEVDSLFPPEKPRNQVDLLSFLEDSRMGKAESQSQHNSSKNDALAVPTTNGDVRQVRKTRSQTNFKLGRKSSFFSSSKQSDRSDEGEWQSAPDSDADPLTDNRHLNGGSKIPKAVGRKSSYSGRGGNQASLSRRTSLAMASADREAPRLKMPWSNAPRLDMADSSPEQERTQPFFSNTDKARKDSLSTVETQKSSSEISRVRSSQIRRDSATRPPSPPSFESKLDSTGGVANLFGSGSSTTRQRASSLLPSMPWRPRTASGTETASSNSRFVRVDAAPKLQHDPIAEQEPKAKKLVTSDFAGDASALVKHVLTKVPRTEIAAVLASTADELHQQALSLYMQRFLFAGNPLDIALRKLLMSLCLPKETQQIDRVMEAFARRYNECNERLFPSEDQPYVLAFSLMMLHTDAFNKNAKQKMSKQDYIRNTASCKLPSVILEYLYDNLTFTQFIYVDDDEVLSRRKSESETSANNTGSSFLSALSSGTSSTSSKNRIDPYYIIATGQTHTLRPDISGIIAEDTPFSAKGTWAKYDIEALNRSFVHAPSIGIVTARRPSIPAAAAMGRDTLSTSFSPVDKEQEQIVTLRVTKVGCVSRKDDIVDENKKAQSRKWRTCGLLLSSSQLLFFKDLAWTSALDQQIREQTAQKQDQPGGVLITPRITYFRPDGVLAMGDAFAVRDTSYTKYKNVFRLIAKQGESSRQYLIQTASEHEMNDWIHKINFCATFRSAGLRVRGLDAPVSPLLEMERSRSFTLPSPSEVGEGEESPIDKSSPFASPPLSPSVSSIFSGIDGASSIMSNGVPLVGLMRRKVIARRKEVVPKLKAVTAKYDAYQSELSESLRFARHLGILTPFMKVTRDRIELTAISLAVQIRQLRLDVAKYRSRKEMLQLELEAGDRAARMTAPSTSFEGEALRKQQNQEREATEYFSLPPSSLPFSERSRQSSQASSPQHRGGEKSSEDLDDLATPKARTLAIDDDGLTHHRGRLRGSLSPALVMGQKNGGGPSPALLSALSTPSEEIGEDFMQVKDFSATFEDSLKSSSEAAGGGSGGTTKTRSSHRLFKPSVQREEAERWDRSKVVRDSNRVSLVTLPDAEYLMDLARIALLHPPQEQHQT